MGISFEKPQDVSAGGSANYLNKPGKYFCAVTKIDEAPKGCIGGWAIEAEVKGVEAGKEDQLNRHVTIKFWPPKPSDKDGGEFGRKKWARAALALGWVTPEHLEKGGGFEVADTGTAVGHLFCVELEQQEKDPRFFDLKFANIFHIDDPDAKDYPRNDKAVNLVPQQFRLRAEQFAFMSSGQPAEKPAAQSSSIDVDSI